MVYYRPKGVHARLAWDIEFLCEAMAGGLRFLMGGSSINMCKTGDSSKPPDALMQHQSKEPATTQYLVLQGSLSGPALSLS